MDIKRLFDIIYYQQEKYPQPDAFVNKENGKWTPTSTAEMIEQINKMSRALLARGFKKGDKIAMISNNRTEWNIMDYAMLQIGVVNVPIYPTISKEDYEYIFNHAEVKMCIVSDAELLEKVLAIKDNVPTLTEGIYTFNHIPAQKHWTELFNEHEKISQEEVDKIKETIEEEDLATLIYTSGTTGKPKGVMLTHKNIVSNVKASLERVPVDETAKALSFLPVCHVYERMLLYLYAYVGVSVYYAESIDTIGDNLREVHPDLFTAVPRLIEKVYDKIVAKGNELRGITRALFFWALKLGEEFELEGKSAWYHLQLKIANKLIFSKWRDAVGGRVKCIVSGAAALNPRLARIFYAAQMPILEGYGLTETSPVISVNSLEKGGMKFGTVGKPLKNVTVKIAEDGEIIVKGPNVMLGYYKNPELTKEVIDAEGFFHTGDIGEIDNEGFLKITDRKKEMFKTSGGKYVAPQQMENRFKESRFIEQIMVIGEGEKHPAALIVPDFEFLKSWAKRKGITYSSNQDLISNPQVIARFQEEVDKYNAHFGKWEQVKKFELLPDPWTIDSGELTPTLKLKRKVILQKYKDVIDKIYGRK